MTEKTSARHHFALFDSLRGLAVLSVIGFHVASLTGRLGEGPAGRVFHVLGGEAVIVFFVISGFLLYRPFVAARAAGRTAPRTGAFLFRRALRIVPAYWVILTVFAIYPGIETLTSGDSWRYYFFLQLYDDDTVLSGLPVAWTLCVEVTFYLLLPLWAAGVRRLRPAPGSEGWVRPELLALGVAALGGFVIQVLAARQVISDTIANTIVGQFPWMALGMALAVASVVAQRRERQPWWSDAVARHSGAIWLVGGVAIVGLALLVPDNGLLGLLAAVTAVRPFGEALAHIVFSGVLATAFVLPAIFGEHAGGVPRRILRFTPVAWIGLASYSIYLWHLPVAQWIALEVVPQFRNDGLGLLDHIETGSTLLLYAATMAVTAALAALTYYGVERPAIDFSHRRTQRPQAASGA